MFPSLTFIMNKGSHIICLLILAGAPLITSSQYGPPIVPLARDAPTLSATTQLPFLPTQKTVRYYAEKELDLQDFPNYSTVLPLADGRSWIKSEELLDTLGRDAPNEGFVPFIVRPPEGHGMMVVIQDLQIPAYNTFNQSLLVIDENGKIIECFSKFMFQIEGKSPVEVCGRTNDQSQSRLSVIDGVGPRSFVVPVGKSISVGFIYRDAEIDKSSSLKRQVPFYDIGYLFRAAISFTAYRACPHGPPFFNENGKKLWPCDIPQSSREAVAACIPENLFCDNVINCGMHDSKEFGVDERFCVEKVARKNESKSLVSHHEKLIRVDTVRLEHTIRNRIINMNRPFGNYNDMMGMGSGKGTTYTPAPVDKSDAMSHPAFVALVILITIICVLIIGLIFRYCCKPCVGKHNPFGDSSNPEAVARFHEAVRNRENDPAQSGRTYAVSFDNIFKPVDDSPPSYDDLFPHDTLNNQSIHKVYSVSSNSNDNEAIPRSNSYPRSSVYTIPVSVSSASANEAPPYIMSPTFVHLEMLPGNSSNNTQLTGSGPVICTANITNEDVDSQVASHSGHRAYRIGST